MRQHRENLKFCHNFYRLFSFANFPSKETDSRHNGLLWRSTSSVSFKIFFKFRLGSTVKRKTRVYRIVAKNTCHGEKHVFMDLDSVSVHKHAKKELANIQPS